MPGMTEWAKDLLLTRGALVESEDAGSLRAMLPDGLAGVLESSEWLSLRFGAGPGSDDEGEWLDRLARLLPADARVTGARLRRSRPTATIDPATALDRHLVIQNGIHRLLDHGPVTARYYFFTFGYTIESDETSVGLWTACLNATGRTVVTRADSFLHAIRDDLEAEPGF